MLSFANDNRKGCVPLTDKRDVLYLMSLVRMDIKRHQKSIDDFAPRPGQPGEEAEAVLDGFVMMQEYRREVLRKLEKEMK